MSLYQGIRPESLDGILGNFATVETLRTLVEKPEDRRNHAILLKGPRGCGKTTIARILAKEFGAQDSSTIEVNAANTNGIGTIRSIAADAPMLGFAGGPKVYIFDESHELTKKAQQCLLKILEDNPTSCYFIFCTTDPQQLIPTIHSRCASFTVGPIRDKEMEVLLKDSCEKAKYTVDPAVLKAIVATSDGEPREALVSLEMVSTVTDIDIALAVLENGTMRDPTVIDLLLHLVKAPELRQKQWKQIMNTYNGITASPEIVRCSIITFLYNKYAKYSNIVDAKDLTHLIGIFSSQGKIGRKGILGGLVARACFETYVDN